MRFILYLLSIFLLSCIKPTDPLTEEDTATLIVHLETYGEALDVDITDGKMVVAANYNGFIVYDVTRDSQGNITALDSIYNDSDMASDMGDNRAQSIVISDNFNIAFITDVYDRIWLYKLGDEENQYIDNYLSDCYGGVWLSTAIDDQLNHINVFSLVKHISSEDDNGETIGDFDQYSTSVVWKKLNLTDSQFPESDASPTCEFSYNFGILPEDIYFSDGLLAVSNGELGVKVLKQLDQSSCFDDQNQLIEEFQSTGDIDSDRIACENSVFDYYNPGLGGNYEPEGGFYPYVFSSFDLPGSVNTVLVRNSTIFSGLSTSNGCYMSLLDNNGIVVDNLSIANGYTINGIDESDGVIALSAGHDGVLLYRSYESSNEGDNLGPIQFIGQIGTAYSNNVKLDGNNLIVSTEDGIYVYLINEK